MSDTTIRIGISTCPNDTFAFHALLNQLVDPRGIDFKFKLLDIQELNSRLFRDEFDIAKASFHAAVLLAERTWVLPSGSALGFGVGPLLLSSRDGAIPQAQHQRTLCPGEHTTATLLFRLLYPDTTRVEQCLFSDIMPALQRNDADFGVCIHEGRFTWQAQGLHLVEDLGVRWERETKCPLPLGGILASKRLPPELAWRVQLCIHDSLQYALNQPDSALQTMRKYAQEFEDDVLMQHVDLYVNRWTEELGQVGESALRELSNRAQSIGLVPASVPGIEVLSPAEP